MSEPLINLLFFAVSAGLGVLFFWPQRGVVWRWRKMQRVDSKIRMEDALKYLYFCEVEARCPTLQSIAGRLQISENGAADLMQAAQAHKFVQLAGDKLCLTPEGRTYALHIVRAHRLWERHLADETGYDEPYWHAKAEDIEHSLTPAEINNLAGRLGYPLLDPHGDPIPTQNGLVAHQRGQALTTLPVGQTARIVHLEDEPEAIYVQLVTSGFYPGMAVRVLEQSQQRVRVWADGDEHLLAPIVAAMITAERFPSPISPAVTSTLADLTPPERGRICSLSRRLRKTERRRLLDLGLVPGTLVEAELISPSGDLTAYRVRETLIALRREQANLVNIERQSVQTAQSRNA